MDVQCDGSMMADGSDCGATVRLLRSAGLEPALMARHYGMTILLQEDPLAMVFALPWGRSRSPLNDRLTGHDVPASLVWTYAGRHSECALAEAAGRGQYLLKCPKRSPKPCAHMR